MTIEQPYEIFLACAPGFEPDLAAEARALFGPTHDLRETPGGVVLEGGWPEVWRANIGLRGAARVLLRFGQFRAPHLAQLDKRARKLPWASLLRPDQPVRVEAVCRRSRIYHQGAAAERVAKALVEATGARLIAGADGAPEETLVIKARIEEDLCTISFDTSGAPLHRRGHKQAVGKAPLRETHAALFLRRCGFGPGDPRMVIDPMCGSGTIPIEAAEIAAGLVPGRDRAFAFEQLASCDPAAVAALRAGAGAGARVPDGPPRFLGYDRDQGAVGMAAQNAAAAGVGPVTGFARQAISDLQPPESAEAGAGVGLMPGLVMVNPPYGARIGNRKLLFALYGSLGQVMRSRFGGWGFGMVTSDGGLAKATGLAFDEISAPIPLGGIQVRLYRVAAL